MARQVHWLRARLEIPPVRAANGAFCASDAHGPERPLRVGSRRHHFRLRPDGFPNRLLGTRSGPGSSRCCLGDARASTALMIAE